MTSDELEKYVEEYITKKPLTRQEEYDRYGVDFVALADKKADYVKRQEYARFDGDVKAKTDKEKKQRDKRMCEVYSNEFKRNFSEEIKKVCIRMEGEVREIYKKYGYEQFKDCVSIVRKIVLDSINERYTEDFLRRNMLDNL